MSAPNKPRTIRFVNHPRGDHWQVWHKRAWRILTHEALDKDMATTLAAISIYNCHADQVAVY